MSTLVECVPNFSEGRDKSKVDAIVDAMKMEGVFLLDREMDADHNRCVITLVGERETIRRGQFEGIRADIATNPTRRPDFGEPRVHPTAGATVVGARKFLIAYNVFLNTPDIEIAKRVAKAVRFSTGGLRFVKGAGFLVRGLAQVSMNLTDFEQTPVHRVFELVKREAARYGVAPLSSEIVGLIPKKALESAAEWFLQIENFDSSLILENRLSAVMGGKMAIGGLRAGVEPFVEQLAAATAVPGGGSASAAAGAMAAALGHMVASLSRGKKSYLQYERELSEAIARLAQLSEELKTAIDADADSYAAVVKAYKHAKESTNGDAVINQALKGAANVPLGVAERSREIVRILEAFRPITIPKMASDLTVGLALAHAAVEGALANVEINLESLTEPRLADELRAQARALQAQTARP